MTYPKVKSIYASFIQQIGQRINKEGPAHGLMISLVELPAESAQASVMKALSRLWKQLRPGSHSDHSGSDPLMPKIFD
jgi:hypothetical protein